MAHLHADDGITAEEDIRRKVHDARLCTLLVRLIAFVTSTNHNSLLGLLALAEPLRANLIQTCEGHISKLDKPKKIDEISRKIPAID